MYYTEHFDRTHVISETHLQLQESVEGVTCVDLGSKGGRASGAPKEPILLLTTNEPAKHSQYLTAVQDAVCKSALFFRKIKRFNHDKPDLPVLVSHCREQPNTAIPPFLTLSESRSKCFEAFDHLEGPELQEREPSSLQLVTSQCEKMHLCRDGLSVYWYSRGWRLFLPRIYSSIGTVFHKL